MKIITTILVLIFSITTTLGACVPNSGLLTPIQVNSVSVQSNGDVIICWEPSTDDDISKYYIIYDIPNSLDNIIIDSIAVGNNCFTILAANNNSSNVSEDYAIGVRDLCDNSNMVNLDYHSTILLTETVDVCTATIDVSWTAYDDFNSGQNVLYNLYAKENGGAYTLVGTTTTLNLTFPNIKQGFTYDFYIEAIEKGGLGPLTTTSNYKNVNTINFLVKPQFLNLYSASVIDTLQTEITFYVDTAADIKEYEILRANDVSGTFTIIGRTPAFENMNPLIHYNDYSVNANQQSYVYKVNAINSCGDLNFTSNIGTTILLQTTSDQLGAKNTITFTNYGNWAGNVLNYKIYRAVNGIWSNNPIATFSQFTGTNTFVDNITDLTIGNGEFCYKIIATEKPFVHEGNLPQATSTSNESCVKHEPIIFVPNAFIPTGDANIIFKPILTYPATDSYLLVIYDRWGHKVFETKDVNEGWNGTSNNSGEMNPVGTYIYSIIFKSTSDEEFKKRGKVTLIR